MKAALVTGSSRGIGRGIALALAEKGFSIAVNGRGEGPAMDETCAAIEARGVQVARVPGDVSDLSLHETMLAAAAERLGTPLTTLVCNAGVGALRRADMLEAQEDSWDHVMNINAKAVFFLTQAFARDLVARERDPSLPYTISIISSVSAVASSINRAEYCVSKAAAAMVAKTFAHRLAPEGIQVFDFQPGVIETDLTAPVLATYEKMNRETPFTLIPRFGQPGEIGKAVAAAANGELPYCVGQVIRPDGGISLQRL
ncbi:3-ketoacyl-ACP reductase [Tropicimonas sp. IMCC6043]|uniref:3-ketoacyl-ACP reductase n=1 Tax=Tropicimonas sp. IMCC6043 TaxID=2510645 RepID=UPI00101D0DA9|nr:3-ketoacyl-ACP reductase [Tropicimonas sp. IMCC6043]RYH06670.1 3-ketoacyl-ACP reductase [Tropicimonas sp. IMCC6043]